jgi:hypothetical protein
MRMKIKDFIISVATLSVLIGSNLMAWDWKDDLEAALRSKLSVSKVSNDRLRVNEPGEVYTLKMEGIVADMATDLTFRGNIVGAGAEVVKQGKAGLIGRLSKKETSRALEPGEPMYLFDVDVKDDHVRLFLITSKTYPTVIKGSTKEMRFKAFIALAYDNKAALQAATVDDVLKESYAVFALRDELVAPKTLKLAMTRAEVEEALGKPERILDLGERVTYVYKDLRVTFTDGKVTDLQ